jgi:hypothetical protein
MRLDKPNARGWYRVRNQLQDQGRVQVRYRVWVQVYDQVWYRGWLQVRDRTSVDPQARNNKCTYPFQTHVEQECGA